MLTMPYRDQKSRITLSSLQLYLNAKNVLNIIHLKESVNVKSATLISICLFNTILPLAGVEVEFIIQASAKLGNISEKKNQ